MFQRSLVFASLLLCVVLPCRATVIALANGGFELLSPTTSIEGWTLDHQAQIGKAIFSPDTKYVHEGIGSGRLALDGAGSATLVSESITLKVGRLYRLSGWIRTEGVYADPTTRYPTAVPTCLTMASFPFTNHSATLGGDSEWTRIETLFIATSSSDQVRLHLGYNGTASGAAWFDDISVEEVDDISQFIAPETVRYFNDAYRWDDRGWIYVHIAGEPYERGYQYGALVADEIVSYINKLSYNQQLEEPAKGWEELRFETDAIFLRSYDKEYLEEMKGISDGALYAGAQVHGRDIDFLDIVTINSVIDLGQLHRALSVTPHALTGEAFLDTEEEMLIENEQHKCSAFVANGDATFNGEIVFGQIFMWNGYTGVHWNVICDIEPASGNRVVYQTFPGGIHSGADFYINSAGIIIGETTVQQTPFEADSTPQSNRIRKAIQYGSSIDEVADILWTKNNGMYTNDWPIADIKTNEAAILLLGTHRKKLWRTSEDVSPFGTSGFLWANNNNRDPEVRKEYVADPDDRPFDLIFSPWNRDIAFNEFYETHAGKIDAIAGVNLWASSPINRAHACDGKITTSEMARELVFLAHSGKVTLREKFPSNGTRPLIRDLPGATPHLSLGYSAVSPIFITDKLQEAQPQYTTEAATKAAKETLDLTIVTDDRGWLVDSKHLWRQTIYPADESFNWFVSASAAYWKMLHDVSAEEDIDEAEAAEQFTGELARLTNRYLYTVSHESDLRAVDARRAYDRYGPYVIPRIKGVFALHQLRLSLGNTVFLEIMNEVHDTCANREMDNQDFINIAEKIAGQQLGDFITQWTERTGLPHIEPKAEISKNRKAGWDLEITLDQGPEIYHAFSHVEVTTANSRSLHLIEIGNGTSKLHFDEKPVKLVLNATEDLPLARSKFYTWSNFIDDFDETLIVYGTSRQIEANHTLALRFQERAADAYVEILPPLVKDSELGIEQAANHDLIVLGSTADNSFLARLQDELPITLGKNFFVWQGETYAASNDGIFLVVPNPANPKRVLYLIIANSALELHEMTKTYNRDIPSWAIFKGDEVTSKGIHPTDGMTIKF